MSGRGNRAVDKDLSKAQLWLALLQAVLGGCRRAVKRAVEVLCKEDYFPRGKQTGPTVLDYTSKQANERLKKKDMLKGKPRSFLSYSPLMIAVLEKREEIVKELMSAGASVAFKNKVGSGGGLTNNKKFFIWGCGLSGALAAVETIWGV